MLRPRSFLPFICVAALTSSGMGQTTVQGEPFGYVKINIAAGTGATKKTSYLSIPLLDEVSIQGQVQGVLTGVGASTLTNADAGWEVGGLSAVTNRFLVEITSGPASGSMLLISTNQNTADTITVESLDVTALDGDLSAAGIAAGNTYRIRPVDTIGSFFGTPTTTGVVGGSSQSAADTITMYDLNARPLTYFFHTTLNRWVRQFPGFPDATHTPIPPYVGLLYSRIGADPLSFTVTGRVPVQTSRSVPVRNAGTTLVSQYWPVATAISNLGFENMDGWLKGINLKTADRIIVSTNAATAPKNYIFHSSSNAWVEARPGLPLSGHIEIPVGASVAVTKAVSGDGYSFLQQTRPYSLQDSPAQ